MSACLPLLDRLRRDYANARAAGLPQTGSLAALLREIATTPGKDPGTLLMARLAKRQRELRQNWNKSHSVSACYQALAEEMALLGSYLPALSDREIETIALRHGALGGHSGSVIAYLRSHHSGRYDPKHADLIVRGVMGE